MCQKDLGKAFYTHLRSNDAIAMYKKARTTFAIIYGKRDISVGYCLTNIANIYSERSETTEAIKYFKRSERILKKYGKITRRILAENLDEMAKCYSNKYCFREAIKCYMKCLRLKIDEHGEDHLEVGEVYCSIARLFSRQRVYNYAILFYKRYLEINVSFFGENNIAVGSLYNEYARLQFFNEDYESALLNFHIEESIRIKNHGYDQLELTEIYELIAICWNRLNDKYREILYYSKALKIKEKLFEKNSKEVVSSLCDLATAYFRKEDYIEAIKCFQKVLNLIASNQDAINSFERQRVYEALGYCFLHEFLFENAFVYFSKAKKLEYQDLGKEYGEISLLNPAMTQTKKLLNLYELPQIEI